MKTRISLGIACLFGTTLLAVALVLGQWSLATSVAGVSILLMVLASATAYMWRTYVDHSHDQFIEFSDGSPSVHLPASSAIDEFFDQSGNGLLTQAQAQTFIDSINNPRSIFRRISERAETWHRSLMISSTYNVQLSRRPKSISEIDFVIPLTVFGGPGIQDGLRVSDGGGSRVSTLASDDLAVFAGAVLRSLIWTAGRQKFDDYVATIEARVLAAMLSNQRQEQPNALGDEIKALGSGEEENSFLVTAASLVDLLTTGHAICISIPASDVMSRQWPNTFRFRVEYRTIPPISTVGVESRTQRFATVFRLALGVRLNRIFIPLGNDIRTPSYHLQVAGPEGSYLALQGTIPPEKDLGLSGRVQPRKGQRRAHLYIRDRSNFGEATFAAHFFERAPGSFAATTASGWAAFVVILMLAVNQVNGPMSGPSSLQAILPALLAVPIAVATWTGFDTTKMARHPSLLSRGLTFFTVVLCLVAFASAVVPRQILVVPDTVWILFAALALGLAVVSSGSWIMRLALENHFSRHGDGE